MNIIIQGVLKKPYPLSGNQTFSYLVFRNGKILTFTQGGDGNFFVKKRAKKCSIVLTALKVGLGSW